jgi:hypothetical protein
LALSSGVGPEPRPLIQSTQVLGFSSGFWHYNLNIFKKDRLYEAVPAKAEDAFGATFMVN